MVVWISLILVKERLGNKRYHVCILGVHHRGHSESSSGDHDFKDLPVTELHRVVSYVELHRRDSVLGQDGQLSFDY